jgi:hypothetical protein
MTAQERLRQALEEFRRRAADMFATRCFRIFGAMHVSNEYTTVTESPHHGLSETEQEIWREDFLRYLEEQRHQEAFDEDSLVLRIHCGYLRHKAYANNRTEREQLLLELEGFQQQLRGHSRSTEGTTVADLFDGAAFGYKNRRIRVSMPENARESQPLMTVEYRNHDH